ncbi:MAG: response regulator, partial [Bacteroidota bacterium]|nr:response regulator [Bacteroidota bacterium]
NHKKTGLQGMGLGLPIVKQVTESLNGELHLESNPIEVPGTKICIVFDKYSLKEKDVPLTQTSERASLIYNIENFNISDSPYDPRKKTIILIEDNIAMLNFLGKKLKSRYNIYCTINGIEALKKLDELAIIPDLILSDIMMDKMDGFAFAKAISEQDAYNHIPVIFLTAKSAPSDKIKGLRLGAIDFIQKPFSFEELNQKVETVLGNIEKQKKAILYSSISNLKAVKHSGTESGNAESSIKLDQKFKLYQLTNREIEISKFILRGIQYKEIARMLFISEKTVSKHVQNIFVKVGVSNKVEFINKLNL